MEFIDGFSWPVPLAFSGAVSACRFEQGDVLYDRRRAYQPWPRGREGLGYQIQVLDPPKGSRASGEGEGSRFATSWASPVELELTDCASAAVRVCRSTQGRLFTCLWRGGVEWLAEDGEAPEPPALARELHRALPAAAPAVRDAIPPPVEPGAWVYLCVVDQASVASRVKAGRIEASLQDRFPVERSDLTPKRAGVEAPERFHPALVVRVLSIGATDRDGIERAIGEGVSTAGESPTERFSLSRHGYLARATEPEDESE